MAVVIKGTSNDVIRFLCEYSQFFKHIFILLCLTWVLISLILVKKFDFILKHRSRSQSFEGSLKLPINEMFR